MGSSKAPVVRGSEKARTGKEVSSRKSTTLYANRPSSKAVPKWAITEYKAPRKISDKELEMARKMFFELDRDGSGSIDAEELGVMLRQMGQNPTEQELKELIDSVDDGDKDGQIQLREFLKLYTESVDAKKSGKAGKDDVRNVFCALGVRGARARRRLRTCEMAAACTCSWLARSSPHATQCCAQVRRTP
jgi:Ca2+-binding EF-hand superfamily protein